MRLFSHLTAFRCLVALMLLSTGTVAPRRAAAQAHDVGVASATSLLCERVSLHWTPDPTAVGTLVLVQKLPASPDSIGSPVLLQDGVPYFGISVFGAGLNLDNRDRYAVYGGPGDSVRVTHLEENTRYRVDVVSYSDTTRYTPDPNGTGSPVGPFYRVLNRPVTATAFFSTPACPLAPLATIPATNLRLTVVDCSTMRLAFHPGNGEGRLVVGHVAYPPLLGPQLEPEQGRVYLGSTLFARGMKLHDDGVFSFVVASGRDTAMTVYGLPPGIAMYFTVHEYNTVRDARGQPTGLRPRYQVGVRPGMMGLPPCAGAQPQYGASDLSQFRDTLQTGGWLRWKQGPGSRGRLVVLTDVLTVPPGDSAQFLSLPKQDTVYRASNVFAQGQRVRPYVYAISDALYPTTTRMPYTDSDTGLLTFYPTPWDSVFVTGLRPGRVYLAGVYEYGYNPFVGLPGNPVPPLTHTYHLTGATVTAALITAAASAPLALHLVSFTGETLPNGANQLQWQVVPGSEAETLNYELQASPDGRNWSAAAAPFAPDLSRHGRYAQRHWPALGLDITYYRVQETDVHGHHTYSPVRSLRETSGATPAPQVWPVPVQAGDQLHVAGSAGWGTLRVRRPTGQVVAEFAPSSESIASTERTLPTGGLAPGLYWLEALTPDGPVYTRFSVTQ